MWQSPPKPTGKSSQKTRAHVRFNIRLKRVMATLAAKGSDAAVVHIMLNDVSRSGAGIFCSRYFGPGEEVLLKMERPIPIEIKAKVIWSQKALQESHILSENSFPYRVGVEFTFESEDARKPVNELCEYIKKNNMAGPELNREIKAAEPPQTQAPAKAEEKAAEGAEQSPAETKPEGETASADPAPPTEGDGEPKS